MKSRSSYMNGGIGSKKRLNLCGARSWKSGGCWKAVQGIALAAVCTLTVWVLAVLFAQAIDVESAMREAQARQVAGLIYGEEKKP